ncbi:MAG: hypothetical protein K2N43_00880 [Lachnospiraceae bacterium]|nr:hypothetical protein [Lachnospiraceae bacterium]
MSLQTDQRENQKRTLKPKQIAALVCVILLLGLYVGAFVVACLDLNDSGRLFAGWLGAMIGLPILLWLLLWSLQLLKKRREENFPPQNPNGEEGND